MNRPTVALSVLLLGGCADDSFTVVSVLTSLGSLDGVTQLRVHVANDSSEQRLLFPQRASEPLHLDTLRAVTFSVEFKSSRAGVATFEVEPLSENQRVLGYGRSTAAINQRGVANVTVKVVPGALRPERSPDAGPPSADDNPLSCDPYAPEAACGEGPTCALLCTSNKPAASMCYGGGVGRPGDACSSNNDCTAGTQCFTFTATGCSVMTCLRFCHDDSACAETDAYCNVPIQCGSSPQFGACSRPCDPTVPSGSGCAVGLACFVYKGETTDCACPGLGTAGATCTQNSGCNGELGCSGCGPGLSCVISTGAPAASGAGVCRPVCRLSASPSCPSGTTCHAFDNSSRRIYGYCQ
jgi:hypothetical protein